MATASATGGNSMSIVQLNGSNYATWKIQCKMALKKDNLWGIVDGTETEPAEDNAGYSKYVVRKDKALAIIVLAVDTTLLYLLGDPDDPKAVWDQLSNQFQKKTWANKLALRRKLYSMRLAEGQSVDEHIKVMTEIFNELSVIGDPLSEEDQVIHLLAGLPDSFNMLVTALEALATVPNMETVIERLRHEERKMSDKSGGGQEQALFSTREGKGPRCYFCNKYGHIKRRCPKLQKSEAHRKSSKPGKPYKAAYKASLKQDDSSDENVTFIAQHALSTSLGVGGWIVDSGATTHMCNDKALFEELRNTESMRVTLGDGHVLEATGVGNVKLNMKLSDTKTKLCTLLEVLYVPGLAYNLLSVSKASEAGMTAVFSNSGCHIKTDNGKVIAAGSRAGSLYCLDYISSAKVYATASSKQSKEDSWHQRYGHLGEYALKKLATENLVDGLTYDPSKKLSFCEPCAEAKNHRTKFPKAGGKRSEEILGLIHSDVCGKVDTKSLGGAQYFLTFIDDKSRYTWVYFLSSKDQVYDKFQEWKAKVEKSTGQKVKVLRTDNGGEYTSRRFEKYLKDEGIRHEVTIPKTPEQNGVSERMNRTLVEMTRSMLHGSPRTFWAEALSTAVYLRNRSPTIAVHGMTPYEAYTGEKPDVAGLKSFGCTCYAHIPKDERKKLDSKSRKCIFLGYGDCVKGYRLYDISRSKVIHSRDVIFNECKFDEIPTSSDVENEFLQVPVVENDPVIDQEEPVMENDAARNQVNELRRSERETKAPERYGEWVNIAQDPRNYQEAMSKDKSKWQKAMETEFCSLQKHAVWDLVSLPEGRKVVGSKWVYKTKTSPEGRIERYKARLVAQGFSQKYGFDYDETFCPVVRAESVRTVIALAAKKNLMLHQMDVATAFLNGTLEEEVYMEQPEGFIKHGEENLVCKLKKSLYGLKQSPRCWNTALDLHLKSLNLKQSSADPCVYTSAGGETVIVAVYVDDIFIATETKQKMLEIKKLIAQKFEVKDLGELKSFLGVQVKVMPDEICIGQCGYTLRILEKFGMSDAKPVSTPMDVTQKLYSVSSSSPVDKLLYQSAVGSLLYLSNWTRPDITYAVNTVAKFSSNPTQAHWTAIKRIMRYLKGTSGFGIRYVKASKQSILGYCDADWAGDADDRKSTSGYVFVLAGAPISWRSKKQTCVALSTAEAEYIALASAAQEAVWLRELINELDGPLTEPTVVFDDSQCAIAMTKNPQFHGRAKHIEIKYHYIRGEVEKGTINLSYCPTQNMMADILTKGLSKEKHCGFRQVMNIEHLD